METAPNSEVIISPWYVDLRMRHVIITIVLAVMFCVCLPSIGLSAEYGTFGSFYEISVWSNPWLWVGVAVFAIGAAAVVFFSGGTASPAVTAIGGWIGSWYGLSGAAAVSHGLAILGGGSIAAGGLGMIGGMAVIKFATVFGCSLLTHYTFDSAMEMYSYSQFVKASKEMSTLPPPRNANGSAGYEEAIDYLNENLIQKNSLSTDYNQGVIRRASITLCEYIKTQEQLKSHPKEGWFWDTTYDPEDEARDKALLALLYFQLNQYEEAKSTAAESRECCVRAEIDSTLPTFIYSVSGLGIEKYGISSSFAESIKNELDNPLIPLLYAIYLDRAMYMYHFGVIEPYVVGNAVEIVKNETTMEGRAQVAAIVTMRFLIEIKRAQQDMLVIFEERTPSFCSNEIIETLELRYKIFCSALETLETDILPLLNDIDDELPDEVDIHYKDVRQLVDQYQAEKERLGQQVAAYR